MVTECTLVDAFCHEFAAVEKCYTMGQKHRKYYTLCKKLLDIDNVNGSSHFDYFMTIIFKIIFLFDELFKLLKEPLTPVRQFLKRF